jgi:hypothetical protein
MEKDESIFICFLISSITDIILTDPIVLLNNFILLRFGNTVLDKSILVLSSNFTPSNSISVTKLKNCNLKIFKSFKIKCIFKFE